MTSAPLPIVPKPLSDEALSSWVERIALFYGGDYELGLRIGISNARPVQGCPPPVCVCSSQVQMSASG